MNRGIVTLGGIVIGALALTTAPAYADVASEHGSTSNEAAVVRTTVRVAGGDQARNHHRAGRTGSFAPRHTRYAWAETRIVGFRATPHRVHKGGRLYLHGALRSRYDYGHWLGHKRIYLYFRPNGSGHWRRIDTIVTRSNGTFGAEGRVYRSGIWSVRYNGGRLGHASAYDYVRVIR